MPRKIIFNGKPLFISGERTPEIEDYLHRPSTLLLEEGGTAALRTMMSELGGQDIYAGVFLVSDEIAVWNGLLGEVTCLEAGGGLVTSPSGVLMIYRRGKWDLPKGKLDKGETIEECALREVAEETGASRLQLGQKITTTYHAYPERGKWIIKAAHWFRMQGEAVPLQPQEDEDITECRWVPLEEVPQLLLETHATIIEVFRKAYPDEASFALLPG